MPKKSKKNIIDKFFSGSIQCLKDQDKRVEKGCRKHKMFK